MSRYLIVSLLLLTKGFTHVTKVSSNRPQNVLKTGWYYVIETKNNYGRRLNKKDDELYIDPTPIVSVKHFKKIDIKDYKSTPYILIQFDAYGTKAWSAATGKAVKDNLHKTKFALVIDDRLVYTPEVETQITSGVSALNRGDFSKEELEQFAKRIQLEMDH
jgi:preprotein translocase subunit SecD